MPTYTSAQLATRVLRDLGLIDQDATPSASDLAWAEETCAAEIALMNAKKIPIWNGSEVSIPSEYLTTLSRRIGLAVAPAFGLADIASATVAMRAAEADLRAIGTIDATGSPSDVDMF